MNKNLFWRFSVSICLFSSAVEQYKKSHQSEESTSTTDESRIGSPNQGGWGGGMKDAYPPPRGKIFSFSYSFLENLVK